MWNQNSPALLFLKGSDRFKLFQLLFFFQGGSQGELDHGNEAFHFRLFRLQGLRMHRIDSLGISHRLAFGLPCGVYSDILRLWTKFTKLTSPSGITFHN